MSDPWGDTEVSIQWRCPRMASHDGARGLPKPCDSCYSIVVTAVSVPYRDPMNWTKVGPAMKGERNARS